jgi:uncharacterized NAD-dependent epimerase/dehydratase family protein
LGKKYTALALAREMADQGFDVDFRASGQTGILISGQGIPIDSVVSDFVSGAAELLSPAAASEEHWDVIEGQGSLFHPGYAAVTAGLLTGITTRRFRGVYRCHPLPHGGVARLSPAQHRGGHRANDPDG